MKLTAILLTLILSNLLFAGELEDLLNGKKPLCSSPIVRLSPKPIPCIPDLNDDGIFDIPELELDLEDIESIFEGAESSGGHVIGPMNAPRRMAGPVTPYRLRLNCEARLLSDGGKRVSFLSKQNFSLSEMAFSRYLYTDQWVHGLTEQRSLYPENWVRVRMTPKVEFKNYSVMLGYDKRVQKPLLTVCEGNLKTAKKSTVAACSEIEFSRYAYTVKTKLISLEVKTDIRIKKTLEITCRLR